MAQQHSVILFDISAEPVELINRRSSPFLDAELEDFSATKPLNFQATLSKREVYADADFIVIATPNDDDRVTNHVCTLSMGRSRQLGDQFGRTHGD